MKISINELKILIKNILKESDLPPSRKEDTTQSVAPIKSKYLQLIDELEKKLSHNSAIHNIVFILRNSQDMKSLTEWDRKMIDLGLERKLGKDEYLKLFNAFRDQLKQVDSPTLQSKPALVIKTPKTSQILNLEKPVNVTKK
jgi:hypothetical protein